MDTLPKSESESSPASNADGMAPLAQLTVITQSLSGSLMTSIQALDALNKRVRALEDQQRVAQHCIAKAMLALGTLAQQVEDEPTQMAVFRTLEEALSEFRKPSAADPAA